MRDTTATLTGLGVPQIYMCKNCWYQGSVIVETERPADFARPARFAKGAKASAGSSFLRIVGVPIIILFAIVIAGFLLSAPGRGEDGRIAVMREAVTGSLVGYRVLGFEDIFLSFFLIFFSLGALALAVYFGLVKRLGKK